jgi:hypothetical protein
MTLISAAEMDFSVMVNAASMTTEHSEFRAVVMLIVICLSSF